MRFLRMIRRLGARRWMGGDGGDTAIWFACRGLPASCRRPGYFLLLAPARAGARANGEAGPKGGEQDARSKEK